MTVSVDLYKTGIRNILQSGFPPGVRVGCVGDSIAQGLNAAYYSGRAVSYGDSPLGYAYMASDGRWDLATIAAVAGQRSDQIAARVTSELVAAGCQIGIIVSCYWNDVGQGLTVAQNLVNVQTMCQSMISGGVLPVVCSPTPDGRTGSTAARIQKMAEMRQSVRKYALDNGIPFLDFLSPLVDPATGTVHTTYNLDGSVHPTIAGYQALGTVIKNFLDTLIGPCGSNLIQFSADPTDLLTGKGMFGTNVAGVGTGWSYTTAAGATASIVTDGAVSGSMQRIAAVASGGPAFMDYTLSGWSVGDTLEVSGIYTTTGDATKCIIRFVYSGAAFSNYVFHNPSGTVTRGRFRYVQQVPVGMTGIALRLQVNAGTATQDVGQLSVRNLTTLGVVA